MVVGVALVAATGVGLPQLPRCNQCRCARQPKAGTGEGRTAEQPEGRGQTRSVHGHRRLLTPPGREKRGAGGDAPRV